VSAPLPPTPPAKRGPGRPRKSESERSRKSPNRKSLSSVKKGSSPEARRLAAAILEVLAGERTTTAAAEALGCTLPRYYHLEARALEGFVAACEPLRPGRQSDPERDTKTLEKKCARLERELGRQQALVRAAHRMVGLQPEQPAKKVAGKKRPRRPTRRALVVVEAFKEPVSESAVSPPIMDPSTSA
jgi:hypothetical protein